MAKAHKLAGTGLGLDTVLSLDDLRSICLAAAPQATGTLWRGQHRIKLVRDSGSALVFEMPALIRAIKQMVFTVSFSEKDGRRRMLTTINDYWTTRPMLSGIIPLGPREMVGHYVYVEFLELVAKTVRQADPTVVARLELGPHQRASIPSAPHSVAAPAILAGAQQPVVPSEIEPEPVLLPVVGTASIAEPAPTPVAVAPAEPEVDRTVIVERRPRRPQWSLAGDDGTEISITGRTVIGRDPRAVDEHDATAAVGVDDASVSASHAVVEVREGRLHVTDLGSTNGTVVLDTDGSEHACSPGVTVEVADGAAIELGAYTLVAGSQLRRPR